MKEKKMKKRLEIASKRFKEMEARKSVFTEKYAETGDTLYRDMANVETENMNKLIVAIMEAKMEEV